MSQKKENKSFLLNTKSSAQFIKGTGGRPAPTAVPFGRNGADEPGSHIAVVQAADQRRAADDSLIDKILNGSLRLKLEVLEKVLPSLANEITLEKLLKELRIFLNVSELTEHRPGQAQSKPKKLAKPKELLKAETVEESNKNELSRNLMLKKPDFFKDARAVSVLLSRLADLYKVLNLLTGFCKKISAHLKIIVERQSVIEDAPALNIRQMIFLKTYPPEYLIKEYKCANLFHLFSTKFYVNYFLKLSAENYLSTPVVDHLRELARWLELYISLLVELKTLVLRLNGRTTPDDYAELHRGFRSEQDQMFLEFKFSDPPCENADFALQLIYVVDAFIEDVCSELSVMW